MEKIDESMLTRRGFIALAAAALPLAACGAFASDGSASTGDAESATDGGSASADGSSDAASGPYATGTHHATIEVADYGTIQVSLNANVAPITVSNFAGLVDEDSTMGSPSIASSVIS